MIKTQTNVYDSSTIESSSYIFETKELYVNFKHATYLYEGVPARDYELFSTAESQGKALNQFIKKYKFTKLENEGSVEAN